MQAFNTANTYQPKVLTNTDITHLIEKHIQLASIHVFRYFDEDVIVSIRKFLTSMLQTLRYDDYSERPTEPYMIAGWNYHHIQKNLYYNEVEGVSLDSLYEQADDRLHHYFNTTDFNATHGYINVIPFAIRIEFKPARHRTKLTKCEVEELIRFHIHDDHWNMYNETDLSIHEYETFLFNALSYYVHYDPDYRGYKMGNMFKSVYHQAYDRILHYMDIKEDRYNMRPFMMTSELAALDRARVEDSDDISEIFRNLSTTMTHDLEDGNIELPRWVAQEEDHVHIMDPDTDVVTITPEEPAVFDDDVMEQLCRKFSGMCL